MRVKELAELADTTVRTVRYYHEIGLLPVPEGATSTRQREYSFEHLARLFRIRYLVESGLSLEQVRLIVVDSAPHGIDVFRELQAAQQEISERIAKLQEQQMRLTELQEQCMQSGAPLATFVPLPDRVHTFYDKVLALTAGDALTTKLVRRERQVVEFLVKWNAVPAQLHGWVDNVNFSDRIIESTAYLYRSFAHIAELDRETARAEIDMHLRRHFAVAAQELQVSSEVFSSSVSEAFDNPVIRSLLMVAFPHPNYQLYITRAIELAKGEEFYVDD